MFHIIIHCKPKKKNTEYYGKVLGCYASIFINYKDYDGAVELAKFYVKEENWKIIELENEYYTFEDKEDLGEDYEQYFEEILEYGYSIVFNLYTEIGDE